MELHSQASFYNFEAASLSFELAWNSTLYPRLVGLELGIRMAQSRLGFHTGSLHWVSLRISFFFFNQKEVFFFRGDEIIFTNFLKPLVIRSGLGFSGVSLTREQRKLFSETNDPARFLRCSLLSWNFLPSSCLE